MKRAGLVVATGIAAIAVVAITVVTLRFVFARLDRIPGVSRGADAPEVARADSVPPASKGPPLEILCRRSRDELLVFARRREFGRPATGCEVRLLDANGTVLRTGRTDEFGVHRSAIPDGTVRVVLVGDGSECALELPPPPPAGWAKPLPVLADRSVVRPGDTVRFRVWDYGAPHAILAFEPEDPAIVPVVFSRTQELHPGFPGPVKQWIALEVAIPDDVRPGTAVATIDGHRMEFPILPRFGPADAPPPKAAPVAADAPPTPGALRLEFRDGLARVACREEFSAALLFGMAGDRLLAHASVPGDGREATAALFLEDEGVREFLVHAVVSTARGFFHASVPGAGSPGNGRRLLLEPAGSEAEGMIRAVLDAEGVPVPAAIAVAVEDPSASSCEPHLESEPGALRVLAPLSMERGGDRIVRALAVPRDGGPPLRATSTVLGAKEAAPPAGPAWVYEGDAVEGTLVPPMTRQATMYIVRFVRIGDSPPFADPGVEIPRHAEIAWSIPKSDRAAAIRMRAGSAIVLETMAGDSGKLGTLDSDLLAGAPLRVESSVSLPDAFGVLLMCEVPIVPAELSPAPIASEPCLAIERELPPRIAAGSIVEARVRVSARPGPSVEGPLPVRVRFQLPAGAVPAEDGWSLCERAPAGTRVDFREGEVLWDLPRLEGPTTLTVRLRFPWKGRFGVPPATATLTESVIRGARSAGAVVVVE